MNELEKKVGEFLRTLEREEHSFEILPKHKLEGASGRVWEIDFAIKDFDKVKYLVECKNIESIQKSTFSTQMSRAYIELCDLLIKLNNGLDNPTVFGIVVVPDIPYVSADDGWEEEFDKWWELFKPINTYFFNLGMFIDEALGILELIRGNIKKPELLSELL